jgi:hypothetical protein
METVNLSQLASRSPLATALAPGKTAVSTRALFFDEFDGPPEGVSLGWLRWFLAPMRDGTFRLDGKSIAIGKANFMFAGGTASTLAEFEERIGIDPSVSRAQNARPAALLQYGMWPLTLFLDASEFDNHRALLCGPRHCGAPERWFVIHVRTQIDSVHTARHAQRLVRRAIWRAVDHHRSASVKRHHDEFVHALASFKTHARPGPR